jgi:hypothetical protein
VAVCRPPEHSLIVTDVPLRPDDAPYLDSPTRAGRLSLNILKQGWGAGELDLGVTEGGLPLIVSLMLTLIMLVVTVGTPPRRSACVAGRIHLSQTPARSVFLTPAPESMPVNNDSDDDTIVEADIENPFIDKTDQQPPSSSSQIDYSLCLTPGNEQAQPEVTNELMTDELLTTDYLDRFDLAFNRKYNLIICQPCGAGIPLSSTHSHLESTRVKRMIWQEHIGSWKLTPVVLPHQPSVRMLPPKAKLIKNITESLKATGLVEDESGIRDITTSADWYLSLPRPDLGPAILGLRVFHGALQCHVCDKLFLSAVGLQSHYSKAKHGSFTDAHHSKTVQTLTEHHSSYFEVIDTVFHPPSNSLPPALEPDFDGDEDFQEAQHLLKLKQQFLMPTEKTAPTKDLRQVLPVYHQLGIHTVLSDLSDIRPILRKPYERQLDNPVYKRLRLVVVTAFKTAMDDLNNLHNSIRMYITNCTP